ncbi:hypothetical protein ACQCN2_06235 [Brevibacillus ginsengisoli]|uniref:hypothetical protein n=1 Tax=Brevibacillus ginsengisoli TaxID=363854 RepID=UPI003CF5D504
MNTQKTITRWRAITTAVAVLFASTSGVMPTAKAAAAQPQFLSQTTINQKADQYAQHIAVLFPKVKQYKHKKVEQGVRKNIVTVELSINGPGTPVLRMNLNKDPGDLRDFTFWEPIGKDSEGDQMYALPKGPDKEISDEQAKKRAKQLIDSLYGANANSYESVSVWREEKPNEPGKKLGPKVNFRAPIASDGKTARYATVIFGTHGEIDRYEIVTKPVVFDKWFAADLDKRVMPNDEIPTSAAVTYKKMLELVPSLKSLPIEQRVYNDVDDTFTIYWKEKEGQERFADGTAELELDAKTGEMSEFIYKIRSNSGPTEALAKQRATDFLNGWLGEKAKDYKVNRMDDWNNGRLKGVFFSYPDHKGEIIILITGNGEIAQVIISREK